MTAEGSQASASAGDQAAHDLAQLLPPSPDVSIARKRLMAAMASGNLTATREVMVSISPSLASGELSLECKAAAAVVEILAAREREAAEAADARERAQQSEARSIAADAARARAESERHEAESTVARERASADDERRRAGEREAVAAGAGEALARVPVEGIQHATRVNELQAVVVSLQTRLRLSEQQVAHGSLRVQSAEAVAEPLRLRVEELEGELSHVKRLLGQSEESVGVLQQHLNVLQARFAESAAPLAVGTDDEREESLAAKLAAAEDPLEVAKASLDAERGRRLELEAEMQRARMQSAEQLDRLRKGTERSVRELQGHVARLQAEAASERQEMSDRLAAACSKAEAEADFRKRAEEGWHEAQQTCEAKAADALHSRQRTAELEGRLVAMEAGQAEAASMRSQLQQALDELAVEKSKLAEQEYREQSNAQQAAAVWQQQAASSIEAATAEAIAAKELAQADAARWRLQADQSKSRIAMASTQLLGLRSSLEAMLQRLASANELSDLSDLSRLLFEVKARLTSMGESLQAHASTSADGGGLSLPTIIRGPSHRVTVQTQGRGATHKAQAGGAATVTAGRAAAARGKPPAAGVRGRAAPPPPSRLPKTGATRRGAG